MANLNGLVARIRTVTAASTPPAGHRVLRAHVLHGRGALLRGAGRLLRDQHHLPQQRVPVQRPRHRREQVHQGEPSPQPPLDPL
eukprot:1189806-Prorocentrum_minimum.AAC.4